ncbi:MAG: hypothetical protein EXR69_00375 [Myxococcales bacterium]|nr:hypothetical protein [Myxococcales bacterium]
MSTHVGWPAPGALILTAALVHLGSPAHAGAPSDALAQTGRFSPDHPESAYHFADEVFGVIADAAAVGPGVIDGFTFGRSLEGRELRAFAVRDPAFPVFRRLLLIANIHALEWIPTEDALAFLLEYAAHPVPGVELVVVPIVNPDGRARVEADLRAGRNLYRRGNSAYVDLNRDWFVHRDSPAIWKALLPGLYTTSASPTSQPETVAIDQLLCPDADARSRARAQTYGSDGRPLPAVYGLAVGAECYPGSGEYGIVPFSAFLSLHSFGGFIYYPWAGRWRRPDVVEGDWRRYQAVAEAMQAAMGAHAYRPRQLARWGFFFRGLGMEIDHAYGQYGIPSLLVETTRSGLERPADLATYFRWYNPRTPDRHVRADVDMLWAWVTAVGEVWPTGGQ